jgi:hypothetical protein
MQLCCCGKGAVGAQIEGSLRFLKEKGHAQAQAINLGERMGTHLQRRCCTAAQSCGTANRNPKPHSAHAQIPLVLSKDMLHQPSCSVLRVALDIYHGLRTSGPQLISSCIDFAQQPGYNGGWKI